MIPFLMSKRLSKPSQCSSLFDSSMLWKRLGHCTNELVCAGRSPRATAQLRELQPFICLPFFVLVQIALDGISSCFDVEVSINMSFARI